MVNYLALKYFTHCEDKYNAKRIEKEAVNNLTKKGIFLVNADYNSLDNVLIIRKINLNVGWNYKFPRRYDTKVRISFNEYIKNNNINAVPYKIIPEISGITDFSIARDIENILGIQINYSLQKQSKEG